VNIHKFYENIKTTYGFVSTALGGETSDKKMSTVFVNMRDYDLVACIGIVSGVASGSVVTLKAYQATTSAGAGSKTITGASDTFTSTHTTDTDILLAQVRGEDLDVDSGFKFVGVELSTNDTGGTEKVAACIQSLRPRYADATLP
jgi:hypothetical protein